MVVCAVAAAVLCFGLVACGETENEAAAGDTHLLFEKRGESYAVTGLEEDCEEEEIVIPYIHEGLPVTVIGEEAFRNNGRIKRVSFPASLKSIEKGAFMNCTALETAAIPDGVETVGGFAFSSCSSLKSAGERAGDGRRRVCL